MFFPVIPLFLHPAPRTSVKPYSKHLRRAGPHPPPPDPEHLLGSEVLKHLEEWGHQDTGDAFEELSLRSGVLEHLEEWGHQDTGDAFEELSLRSGVLEHLEEWADADAGDILARPSDSETWRELPQPPARRTPAREHPLWDRDLDG
jgi:hypothetical protein